jgi:hypothetical protein
MPIVVCRPVDVSELHRLAPHIPIPDAHKDSTVGKCSDCGEDVWLGPAQGALVAEVSLEPAIILCILCGIAAMREHGIGMDRVQRLTDKETPFRNADGTINTTFGKEQP